MRIAIATEDGISVSRHFGRSAFFLVLDVMEDATIKNREMRENSFTEHARGSCHQDGHRNESHSHSAVIGALEDCEAVLAGGMGWRAAGELSGHGIKTFVTEPDCSVEQAVSLYLTGKLKPASAVCCR
jgi:predicted Fe-Mo cluster-binding NifX family protein